MLKTTFIAVGMTATAAAVPTFPTQWNADSASKVMTWQGATRNPDGSACCDKTSPGCKVQVQAQAGRQYVDSPNKRIALVSGSKAVFTFFGGNPTGESMQFLAEKNGTHFVCKQYCPLADGHNHFTDPLKFDSKAQDQGAKTIQGKTYEGWHWFDSIAGFIHMDEQQWYVDQSGSAPVPFENIEKLTPFGGAEIAEFTAAWDGFTPAKSPELFDVQGLAVCPESQRCGSGNLNQVNMIHHAKDMKLPSFTQVATAKVEAAAASSVSAVLDTAALGASANSGAGRKLAASWAADWTAEETSSLVINQGGVPSQDGSQLCCASDFGASCQLQIQYHSGTRYYDYTNQRSRLEDPNNGIEVDDYKAHKSMIVVHNGTHDVCQKYCPIDPRDTLDAGKTHFLDDNATDLGKATYHNQSAEHWQWKEQILKAITMQTTDFYASTSGNTVVPLGRIDTLTPFGGPKIGQGEATWSSFEAGTPPADKFDIQGMDTCPQDPQCGHQSRQLNRLVLGQTHTFYNNLVAMQY